MLLRIFIFIFYGDLIFSKINVFYAIFATTLIYFLPMHIIIFAPAAIMFYLEKKREIKINNKILDNNKIFIPYLILSIPALIAELLWILTAIIGVLAPLPDMLQNLFIVSPFENWILIFSPDFYKVLFLCFI